MPGKVVEDAVCEEESAATLFSEDAMEKCTYYTRDTWGLISGWPEHTSVRYSTVQYSTVVSAVLVHVSPV